MALAQQVQAVRGQADAQLQVLRQQLAELQRRVFGPRSEVIHTGQAELWTEKVALPVPPEEHRHVKGHDRRRRGRPAIDASLPRQRVEYDLSDEDKAQFERVQRIGEEITETLEYTPAKLVVLQHVRLKYRCDNDDGSSTVRTAFAQPSPLAKCNAGASLLAHVVVSKYQDHCPLARRERIFGRDGLELSRQTQCDWILRTTELLQPLMPVLRERLLQAPVIFSGRHHAGAARAEGPVPGPARQDDHRPCMDLYLGRLPARRARAVATRGPGRAVRLQRQPRRRASTTNTAGLVGVAAGR